MIEKVSFLDTSVNCVDYNGYVHNVAEGGIINKLNELVDAVNKLETMAKNTNTVLESLVAENGNFAKNAQDPYAEQRKWIGKLCKFWDDEDEGYVYEILIDIEDDGSDYPYKMTDTDSENWTMSYKHCEPVSEDLIYKGE